MAGGLVVPSHHPKRHDRLAVAEEQPGNNRVQRPLVGRDDAGVRGSVRNSLPRLCRRTPVVGSKMPLPNGANSELINDTALRSRSTAQTYTVSLCSVRSQSSGSEALPGSMRSDTGSVNASERKPRNWHVALRRVAEVGIAGAIRRLGGLGKKMDTIRLAVPAVPKRQIFDNAQDHEGGQPLSGRRHSQTLYPR